MTELPNTRTSERVESNTVEVTEYQCANCRQWYEDESDIVPVALNAAADAPADADEVAALCRGCADAVFGYEGAGESRLSELEGAVSEDRPTDGILNRVREDHQSGTDHVAITITVVMAAITAWVGMEVMSQINTAVSEQEIQQASREFTTTAPGMMDLVGVFLVVAVLSVMIVPLFSLRAPK